MNLILKMQNNIQTYAWGSRSSIAKLMARPHPTEQPEAELWLGAHPKSPSKVWVEKEWLEMNKWIAQSPEAILGPWVCSRFNNTLPYLLKILAADEPLSIQAHPNIEDARNGFDRENLQKIPMDAPHRNYKDPFHKPETICALTPFWALCGFRDRNEMLSHLSPVWPDMYRDNLEILENHSIKHFFENLMTLGDNLRKRLVEQAIEKADIINSTIEQQWMVRLQAKYPGDICVLSPAFLNLIQLNPGEALALESSLLHAYLEGVGIELMANSDNVLRGGLTPKHVDVPELLSVLTFDAYYPKPLRAQSSSKTEKVYPSHAEEFVLSVIEISDQDEFITEKRSYCPEVLLCIDGKASIRWRDDMDAVALSQGESAFVTAMVDHYTISGNARIYRAGVNLNH